MCFRPRRKPRNNELPYSNHLHLLSKQACLTFATSHLLTLLQIDITTLNGATITAVLPDSGADISAAGMGILSKLNKHIENLLPSYIILKPANGTKIHPVCKQKHLDDLRIYHQHHWNIDVLENIEGTWIFTSQLTLLSIL